MDTREKIKFIFCSFVPVGLEDYVDYMRDHFTDFIYFKWRFHFIERRKISSCMQVFQKGILQKEKRLYSLPKINNKYLYFLTLPVVYTFYLFQIIKNLFRERGNNKVVIFMGVNYFCTLCGIILKFLGSIDFIIYRVMDFFPLPKEGFYRFYNRIFYKMDNISLNYSDAIWFTTIGHIEGRSEYGYFDRNKYYYQIIPLGIKQENFISIPLSAVKPYSIIYCGVISKYHLLNMLFNAINNLKTKYSDIQLNIIGSGPDELFFKQLAVEMGLDRNICFHGFVKDGPLFAKIISENSIGVALYRDDEDFMRYTEPAKVKTYLGYGVPVIVSNVPRIAEEISQNKVGFKINNSLEELCDTLKLFFDNKEMQNEYRRNIMDYVKGFDIREMLDKTFNNTFAKIGI